MKLNSKLRVVPIFCTLATLACSLPTTATAIATQASLPTPFAIIATHDQVLTRTINPRHPNAWAFQRAFEE